MLAVESQLYEVDTGVPSGSYTVVEFTLQYNGSPCVGYVLKLLHVRKTYGVFGARFARMVLTEDESCPPDGSVPTTVQEND